MTKQKHIPILAGAAIIAVVLCSWIALSAKHAAAPAEARLLYNQAGWGYDILVNGNVVIHQPVMPAHGGSKGFGNKTQALHAAQLVISRLGNKDFPRLSQQEVDSLNSRYHD